LAVWSKGFALGLLTVDNPRVGNLGKNLRATRKKMGLSQVALAQRSGLEQGEISRIERGLRDPQISTVEKLAAAVEMAPGRLLD
jgi:transcriptional regulator with XRE-family HTH domain